MEERKTARAEQREGRRRADIKIEATCVWHVAVVSILLRGINDSGAHRFFDYSGKRLGVTDCQVGKYFTIQSNAGPFQGVDQTTVGGPILTGSGIDPGDPQPTQVAFAIAAIAIGVPQAFQHGLIRPPKQAMASAKLTLSHFKDLLVMPTAMRSGLYTSHDSHSCTLLSAGEDQAKARNSPVVCTQQWRKILTIFPLLSGTR
jgi:hypothetical protein